MLPERKDESLAHFGSDEFEKWVASFDIAAQWQMRCRLERADRPVQRVVHRHTEHDLHYIRPATECCHRAAGDLRQQEIIRVDEKNDRAAAELKSGVQRRGLPAVRLVHHHDSFAESIDDHLRQEAHNCSCCC